MIDVAAAVVVTAAVSGAAATAVVVRMASVQARTIGALLLAAAVPLVAVLTTGLVMLDHMYYVVILAVALASGLVAVGTGIALVRSINRPLALVSETAAELAAGELAARVPPTGAMETDRVATAFNTMATEVERLFETRKELVAWASHDLRTPVTAISAMVEALEDGVGTPEELTPEIRSQLDRLSALIDALNELARIEAGRVDLAPELLALRDLVRLCVDGFQGEAQARGVRLVLDVAQEDRPVRCAPAAVERAVMNLLANALRHSPPGGTITVRAAVTAGTLQITVDDEGPGLPAGPPERLFEHFVTGDASRGSGSGLGLAITKALADAQGGRAWAERRPGAGARFAFAVPLARE